MKMYNRYNMEWKYAGKMEDISTLFIVSWLIGGSLASCGIKVCLNWKISDKTLTLICKVDRLDMAISFQNPSAKQIAHCFPPYPEKLCSFYTSYKNGSIIQNVKTNETTLKIHGHIDDSFNGKWTCHHGSKIADAAVDVTVLRMKELQIDYVKNGSLIPDNRSHEGNDMHDCLERTMLYGMCTYLASLLFLIFCAMKCNLPKVECINQRFKGALWRLMFILACTIAFCAFCLLSEILGRPSVECITKYIMGALGIPIGFLVGLVFFKAEGTLPTGPDSRTKKADTEIQPSSDNVDTNNQEEDNFICRNMDQVQDE